MKLTQLEAEKGFVCGGVQHAIPRIRSSVLALKGCTPSVSIFYLK